MVLVKLWPSRTGFPHPHGVVHIACGLARNRRTDRDWYETTDENTADAELPSYRFYWCTFRACFGQDNPRPFPSWTR